MEHEYTPPKKLAAPDNKELLEYERATRVRSAARTVLRVAMNEAIPHHERFRGIRGKSAEAKLGIMAVFVTGHQYFAGRRAETAPNMWGAEIVSQGDALAINQPEITLETAPELKDTDRPRLSWKRDAAAVVNVPQPKQTSDSASDQTKALLHPAAMRQEAARKARSTQLAHSLGVYATAIIAALFAVAAFILLS